ncbi:SusD/RagB family nutrient-binding outer membrane lipoprotein [Sunxiuqinia elliptica]|uniref:Susd and RagB outer membrane lipoprotein n=1 Tax=Sunxiuqinia elliptica TaxID=655355 RepID=A0A1I2I463_9BACT|nr:SusD/RagB family nutrient-binding outer membrane lipoprotein [Sunxiuqinia elliptica]SFF37229.1 Susd and RagB outer membrane lipoprotein [Sunxiuqinia elliptica]
MKKTFNIIFALIFLMTWGCDKEKFADLNSNPSDLSAPELRYSVTKAVEQMYGNDYTNWFYSNFQYIYPWAQVTTVQGGNGPGLVEMGDFGTQNPYKELFPQTQDIRYSVEAMSEENKALHQAMVAITYPIQIQPSMTITDLTGSMVYSEAGLAPYTNPPLITPKFDAQEELFNTWLNELDLALEILTTAENQVVLGDQDVIYGGDYSKWAKYCNLLKLKIAVRLQGVNPTKANQIAEEVATSPAGYMDDLTDDFVYNRGVKYHGTGNGFWIGYASKNLVDFMVENQDPRVRFIFEKNGFNAEVVQAFIDAEKALPPYVEEYVEYDADGNFAGWKGAGEPWVRYHGVPLAPDATLDAANNIYFDQGNLYKISLDDKEKTYSATSLFSEKLVRTTYDYTYPTKPGGRVIQLKDNDPPLHVILGSAAETNLYLAEFKLLGANLPKSAQDYFNRGVELSILRADALAENNQMPYYNTDPVYLDPTKAEEASTKLKNGEVEHLLEQPAYDLGENGLEKVYIQQYINFANTPGDMWTLVRRSGIPKKGSDLLPWDELLSSGSELTVPRRFTINTLTEDDKNFENKKQAMEEQGFTTGTINPEVLNSERLWFDKSNPTYGAGPQ